MRGANRHRAQGQLVSVVRHADGLVLGQARAADKSNEITAVLSVVAGPGALWALAGTVTTLDALLPRRRIAAQIRRQHGHSLLVVKANQPGLSTAIGQLFTEPPPSEATDDAESVTTTDCDTAMDSSSYLLIACDAL